MIALVAILVPLLVVDVMNPVLLAAEVYCLGSRRPFANVAALLAGWTAVYLPAGVVIALGLDAVIDLLANPRPVDFAIQTVIAAGLLAFAWRWTRPAAKEKEAEKEKRLRRAAVLAPPAAFGMGALVNVLGLPFAIPYVAVMGEIMKADLGFVPSTAVLVAYNLLYVAPFAFLAALRWAHRRRTDALFEKLNRWMTKANDVLMPILLVGLALLLLADAAAWLATGTPLLRVAPAPAAAP